MHIVYTDGGKRKGRGAYAFIVVQAKHASFKHDYNGLSSGVIKHIGYGLIDPLLNSAEAEIVAAREAIIHIREADVFKPLIVSDNMYVVHGVRNPHKMMQNRSTYDHVWKPILERVVFEPIPTAHVKGHRNHTFNVLADFICNEVLDNREERLARKIHLFKHNERWRKSLVRTAK